MARFLGLDLGSSSIGWAVIEYGNNADSMSIIDLGSRIIPIDGDTLNKFSTGQAIDENAKRTARRTARKMLDRHQQRRKNLREYLIEHGIPENPELVHLDQLALWELRAAAAERRIDLDQLHRVLMHVSQKRGYNASKADLADDASRGYVADVRDRYLHIKSTGMTIGQYYYDELKKNPNFRVKGDDRVLPRAAYLDEANEILSTQAEFYPEILTPDAIDHIVNYIMFYQRPLKSCKHLVNECEHSRRVVLTADNRKIEVAPKVAHRSNPLFEESRILQTVNNIVLRNTANEEYPLTPEHRRRIYEFLKVNSALKLSDLYSIIFNKKRNAQWKASDNIGKGIPGNRTFQRIKQALSGKYDNLLTFDIVTTETVDNATGEIRRIVDPGVIEQPLYRLWHTLYSIRDVDTLKHTLTTNFGIQDTKVLEALAAIDFTKDGYGNMSVKAIRRIMPYLIEGNTYYSACELAGFRHSDYLTNEENEQRELDKQLNQIAKGELRQPIVEKILNQTVNVVNALLNEYGPFDEIHIELARELQQSREERNDTSKRISGQEKQNKTLAKHLESDYQLTPTRTRITKLKLWEESMHKCMYCDCPVNGAEFLEGINYEVEHIIPKSLLFDDSYANKVCACRKCNRDKGNMTAYDFMSSKGPVALAEYLKRIDSLNESKKISGHKHRYLRMAQADIPSDFIDRQLRQSQYIARKATEMMHQICRNVVPTSGAVTAYLRHIWGWNSVLHDLNYPRYSLNEDLVDAATHKINEWDKRTDHRHHAIDALVIACTTRSIIKRLNDVSSLSGGDMHPFLGRTPSERQSRLERFALSLPHFAQSQVMDAAANILISIKPVTRVTTPGKRYVRHGRHADIAQNGIRVPRGPLHEETIHGMIKRYDDKGNLVDTTVTKRKLTDFTTEKEALKIVDSHIRRLVIERLRNSADNKSAFAQPLYSDAAQTQQIRSVRAFTNLSAPIAVRYDDCGKAISFAKPGANHHIAIYRDADGKLQEHVVTFMHAVERARRQIPAIITDPQAVWSQILDSGVEHPKEFLNQLPDDKWQYVMSMQRNEMFVLGLSDHEYNQAIADKDYRLLGNHLYRVQNLSTHSYCFVLHTQTRPIISDYNKSDNRFVRIRSLNALKSAQPRKVSINLLGAIKDDK